MRSKLSKLLFALVFGFSLSLIAIDSAQAYQCRWAGGYWAYGYWHPARRVCWNNGPYYRYNNYGYRRCGWIPAHWQRGYYVPGHRACW